MDSSIGSCHRRCATPKPPIIGDWRLASYGYTTDTDFKLLG